MNNEGAFFAFIVAMAAKGNAINPRGILPILSPSPLGSSRPLLADRGGRTPRALLSRHSVTFGLLGDPISKQSQVHALLRRRRYLVRKKHTRAILCSLSPSC